MSQEINNNNNSKSVQFSRFIKISFTYPGDEYDRSALEPAKLTFSEATELMQLRIDWKQEMNRRIEQQRQQMLLQQEQEESEDDYSSDDARVPVPRGPRSPRSSSSCASSSALSHQNLSSGSSGSCNSPGSEDEYDQDFNSKSLGASAMMHRHSQLHHSKENMPCLA